MFSFIGQWTIIENTFVTNHSDRWLCIKQYPPLQKNKLPNDKNVFAEVFDKLTEATRRIGHLT